MALTTLEKLVRLERRIIDAKKAIRNSDLVKTAILLDSAGRKVNDLIEDLIVYKRYYNAKKDTGESD